MKTLFPTEPSIGNKSLESLWEMIKGRIQPLIEQDEFQIWIQPITVGPSSENTLQLDVPNLVFYQEFTEVYLDKIDSIKNMLGYEYLTIQVDVKNSTQKYTPPPIEIERECRPIQNLPVYEKANSAPFSKSLDKTPSQIDPAYNFESFVRGPSNQFAVASCQNVAENPGKSYNPLFIYGHTGLGKTHLMHAVGNTVLDINPNTVVTYVRSESFMNEMIYCIRHNKTWDFRQKYRNCDVLLVDDIQFISGKKATQEEFFHTFNSLYEAKKQIVITSDMFPQDIPDIEERLRNRFQWGLIADIQAPDVEHRMAILFNKAEKLGINLDRAVAEYISVHAKRNVRELEGALHRIHAFATLHGRSIDMQLATETFQHVLGEPPKRLTIETIQKTVAEHFKLRVSDLKSKKRQRALTLPRQIAMYLSRNLTKSSFPEIGTNFGGKDHTTVMHAVKKIKADKLRDLDLKAHIESLERNLEQMQ